MKKGIYSNPTLSNKIEIICKSVWNYALPKSELDTLSALIEYSSSTTITLDTILYSSLKQKTGLSDSGFSTALARLEKKDLIRRIGKTVLINKVFENLPSLQMLIINFNETLDKDNTLNK